MKNYKPGDVIPASLGNQVNTLFSHFMGPSGGRGPLGFGAENQKQVGIHLAEITDVPDDLESSASSDSSESVFTVFRGYLLYYAYQDAADETSDESSQSSGSDSEGDKWQRYGNKIEIDASGFGSELDDLEVGDRVVVFWHPQRHTYIPIRGGGTTTTTTVESGGSDCGCSQYVVEGEVDCFGTADSPRTYQIDSFGQFGSVELVYDSNCTWISDELELSCEDESSNSSSESTS